MKKYCITLTLQICCCSNLMQKPKIICKRRNCLSDNKHRLETTKRIEEPSLAKSIETKKSA